MNIFAVTPSWFWAVVVVVIACAVYMEWHHKQVGKKEEDR